ncbi:MAG: hypothetical protein HKN72_06340 [Gemmatimonadetes bacterium]|nr:hypothetical protein [Gemmatimonadota bacterium]NNF12819.1 hypothetical protein [Gemmatimonadota bacterium]
MYRAPSVLALIALSLGAAACSQDTPAGPILTTFDDAPRVNPPLLTQADLTRTDSVQLLPDTPAEGLAAADFNGDSFNRPLAQIFNERSTGDFQAGFAGVYGYHDYIGNVGRVSTEANVSYQNQHLGSAPLSTQQYTPFLLDFGRRKSIWAFPKIYTDQKCGLTVQGKSQHRASWQFYQATSVQNWGVTEKGTQSKPHSQGACTGDTGGFQSEHTKAGGVVCTYWITYDLDTGAIISAELLFCSSTSGEVM